MSFFIVGKGLAKSNEFDSVKIYCIPYYSERVIKIDQSLLMVEGDSIVISDKILGNKLFIDLKQLIKKRPLKTLKKLRDNFAPFAINVRAVFVFYKGKQKITIGISSQALMFVDDLVFEKKDRKLENIVKPSKQLYKMLFPTKEEIINKN